jgi:hypothetical protein
MHESPTAVELEDAANAAEDERNDSLFLEEFVAALARAEEKEVDPALLEALTEMWEMPEPHTDLIQNPYDTETIELPSYTGIDL